MREIELDIYGGGNSDMEFSRMFEGLEDPREVHRLVAPRRDGTDALCEVTGWSGSGPQPANAVKVSDSGAGVSLLIYGGDEGIRLRPASSTAPWSLYDPEQWGEPCLLLDPDTAGE